MKLSAVASMLAIAFLGSCGVDSQQNNEENLNTGKEIVGEERAAVESAAQNAPQKLVTRVPMINGVPQHDKAEVVAVYGNVDTNTPEAIEAAFNGGQSADADLINSELDQNSSSDSHWGWRYRSGYRWGCGWGGRCAPRCVGRVGCGTAVYYRTGYAWGGAHYGAYRPYRAGFGCARRNYYYSSYAVSRSWYSYGGATCATGACGGGVVYRTW